MENEQLLIGIARFFICERLVFAQPLLKYIPHHNSIMVDKFSVLLKFSRNNKLN